MKKNITIALLAITATSFAAAAPTPRINLQQDHMKMESKMMHKDIAMTGAFKGVEVNGGSAHLYKEGNKFHLHFSDDFKTPGSPSPHWQVVDAKGNTYLLQRITIAGDKTNRDIVLPNYITSVKKVQVWCSFAEVVLGEASFPMMEKTR